VDCITNTDLNRLQRDPMRFLRTTGLRNERRLRRIFITLVAIYLPYATPVSTALLPSETAIVRG